MLYVVLENEGLQGEEGKEGDEEEIEERGKKTRKEDEDEEGKDEEMLEAKFKSDKGMVDSKKNKIEIEYEVGEIVAMELEEGAIEEVVKDNLVGTHDNHTSCSTHPSNTPLPPSMPP